MADLAMNEQLITKNLCYIAHRPFSGEKPRGIIVHSNGCQGVPAAAWPSRWNNPTTLKAAHAHVDALGIVQALPFDIQGWHAGGSANATHLGFELSEPIIDTPADFAAAWKNGVDLTAYWCQMFGLTEHNVVAHCEAHALGIASNHGDVLSDPNYARVPGHRGQGYFTRNGATMDDFREAVRLALVAPVAPTPAPAKIIPPTVLFHSIGATVRQLQTALNAALAGTKGFTALVVDGAFGKLTDAAVRAFQKARGLQVDGIVGPQTWAALLA